MKLYCLTLTWNGLDKLSKLKDGLFNNLKLFKNKYNIDSEWHIRDNGSKDFTVQAASVWENTKVYNIGHNRDSYAIGMNYLIEKAELKDDDLVLMLNNDIEFGEENSLCKMYDLMRKTNAGIIGARLLYTGTNKIAHAGVIFSQKYNFLPYHYRAEEESDKAAEKDRYFQAVTAALCLVKASSLKRVGNFDTNLIWSFDDISLNLSIGQTEKIAYCGSVKVFHDQSSTLRLNPVNKLYVNHNVSYFKKKHFGKYDIDHDKYLNNPDHNVIKD
jgi:GT2 family glycosyltransferase